MRPNWPAIAAAVLITVAALGLLFRVSNAFDRRERENYQEVLRLRDSNPDAKACRALGGFPVWGTGFGASTVDIVGCKPLDAK